MFYRIYKELLKKYCVHYRESVFRLGGLKNFGIKAKTATEKMANYRLSRSIIPQSYNLFLYPNLATGKYNGKIEIKVNVLERVNEIKIHSKGLTITKATLDDKKVNIEEDPTHECLVLSFEKESPIEKGSKVINVEYSGSMVNKIVGIYKSTYVDDKGRTRSIATTKFEPTYARQAFPCFDEPNMKATYTFHVLKPRSDPSYIALSNMPVESEEEVEDGILVNFKESVKMSTYLASIIVCDFNYTETTFGSENKPLRVYATPAQIGKTEFAKWVAKGVIEYFTDYFNIPYPLPKLDMIAIPDFVSGAMEHWGLVTYRETALLYDNTTSSTINKQRVATVVAHELTHSWFGNLVTTDWWNDLWLNEGFASYIEYKGVNAVLPEWQMLTQFLIMDLHPVLSTDAKLSSHPIIQTVNTPDEITAIFDSISYNKGASVLRMLEDTVGQEKFRKGITNFLNAHKWGTAVSQDLWNQLQEIVGDSLNITSFMDSWTVQMGYPIVTVKVKDDNYILTQKRFLTDPDAVSDTSSPYGYKWSIPITYITSEESAPKRVWFNHTNENITIPIPSGATWVKFNYNQVGYYRINYNRDLWDSLTRNFNSLTVADQTHLLEESFSIAEANLLDYSIPLNLTKQLQSETEYIPWTVASKKLRMLKTYLTDSLQYSKFLEYAVDIVTPAYRKLTWNESSSDTHLEKRARATILSLACAMGHTGCLAEAKKRFQEWLANSTEVNLSQDLKSTIYNYGIESATAEEWEKMFQIFANELDAGEKLRLMSGLASIKETWLLKKLLVLAEDETYVRSQDYFTLLSYISSNSVGTALVWDYVRENWEALANRFTLNNRYLGTLIPSITNTFSTTTKLNEMRTFFEQHPNAGAGARYRTQALETVQNNIKWLERNKETVEKWLGNYQKTQS
ncbi:glutamyl aminopeptidase isoform X2 [Agrilus planipennis]|uniref:Aminopeptidase n=1 Tax=Agrilus planipennis TaxID=224129 RepID=A0A1W4WP24_AGRPL|nr:glutamyl aminopeptidase isoform X2 [Agrilus planipennis]